MIINKLGLNNNTSYQNSTGKAFNITSGDINRIAQVTDCSDNNVASEIQKAKMLIGKLNLLDNQINIAINNANRVDRNSPNLQYYKNAVLELIKQATNLIPSISQKLAIIKDLLKCGGLSKVHERVLNELQGTLENELGDLERLNDIAKRQPKEYDIKHFPNALPTQIIKAKRLLHNIKENTETTLTEFSKKPFVKEAIITGGIVLGGTAEILNGFGEANKFLNGQ